MTNVCQQIVSSDLGGVTTCADCVWMSSAPLAGLVAKAHVAEYPTHVVVTVVRRVEVSRWAADGVLAPLRCDSTGFVGP